MEKKNTILLTVIAIATLLVAVVGATFAYFASNIDTSGGNVDVNVNTSDKKAIFLAQADGNIDLQIDSYMMQVGDADASNINTSNDTNIAKNLVSTANLNVSLQASDEGKVSTCSYDLVYKWNANSANNFETNSSVVEQGSGNNKYYKSKYYERSNGGVTEGFKELTVEISSMTYTGAGEEDRGASGNSLSETNIDAIAQVTNDGKIALLKGETISSTKASLSNIPHIDYEVTFRFYNLPIDQSKLMSKDFGGTISVENVVC